MSSTIRSTIVVVTDRRYFLPVFVLILSLKYHNVKAYIKVLGVGLTQEERELLEQFEHVAVFAGDPSNKRNPASRKAEAMLLAENDDIDSISLLDGDCIVTGDITPYLVRHTDGISARKKSKEEDGVVFSDQNKYTSEDQYGTVPKSILAVWQRDVGERSESRIENTVTGGNLSIGMAHLDFIRSWHEQIMKVLPNKPNKMAYDYSDHAYFQMDESVLNSLLAFKEVVPPVYTGWFDQDPDAYVAHLGPCNPRYWKFWRCDRLKYYAPVMALLDWGGKEYSLPTLTWALKKHYKPVVYSVAYVYEVKNILKKGAKRILGR